MNPINITSGAPPLPLNQVVTNPIEQTKNNFGNIIKDTIANTVKAEQQGEQAIERLASGQEIGRASCRERVFRAV